MRFPYVHDRIAKSILSLYLSIFRRCPTRFINGDTGSGWVTQVIEAIRLMKWAMISQWSTWAQVSSCGSPQSTSEEKDIHKGWHRGRTRQSGYAGNAARIFSALRMTRDTLSFIHLKYRENGSERRWREVSYLRFARQRNPQVLGRRKQHRS